MKVLVYSTNGILRDGITSWMREYFARITLPDSSFHTLAFERTPAQMLDEISKLGLKVHEVPSRRSRPIHFFWALRRLLYREGFDAIHINGNSGTVALDLAAAVGTHTRVRIVHSRNTSGTHQIYDRVLRPVMHILTTDRLACDQDAGRWLFGSAAFTVLHNGRDLSSYAFNAESRRRVRTQLGINDRATLVGHVGSFNAQKNHKFLIDVFAEACSRNPELHLVLVGAGPLQNSVIRYVRCLGLSQNITFLGECQDVAEVLSALDLAMLPSLYEGLPNVVIEWQANGLPSIVSSTVTRECAVTDLVKFCPVGEVEPWVRALTSSPVLDRTTASDLARRRLADTGFDIDQGVAALQSIYEQIRTRLHDL